MPDRHFLIALAAGFIALAAGVITYRYANSPEHPVSLKAGTALGAQARPIPEFTLVDHAGNRFDSARLRDRWTFLFFGYTHCPDICPATLATLDMTIDDIRSKDESKDTQVIFISVDPERDSPQRLKEYVEYFSSDFIGATGEPAELGRLALALGIPYAKLQPSQSDQTYLVDHGAAILLVGPSGRLEAVFGPPHDAGTLALDFLKLRSRA